MRERLQKILARAGIGSRRHNEELITAGRVQVNGRVARLGDSADPLHDTILLDGDRLNLQSPIYIMLNKPKGILSSTEDEMDAGRATIRDLVDVPGHLYPVGRLDKQSEGLILLTNDGELAHRLTHPRYEHAKTYLVWLDGHVPGEILAEWRRGVELEGEKTAPTEIDVVKTTSRITVLRIIMREGRKRQIRRIAAQLGYPVQRLLRTHIGPLAMTDLEPGSWRHLTPAEVRFLRREIEASPPKPKRPLAPARSGRPPRAPESRPGQGKRKPDPRRRGV